MESGRGEQWVERAWVHVHFLRVVLPQFRLSLSVFLGVNLLGALVIWTQGATPRTFWQALHTALALNFLEMVVVEARSVPTAPAFYEPITTCTPRRRARGSFLTRFRFAMAP